MSDLEALRPIPTRRTALGFEYVALGDVAWPWRDQVWDWLPQWNARLIVDGVGQAVLLAASAATGQRTQVTSAALQPVVRNEANVQPAVGAMT